MVDPYRRISLNNLLLKVNDVTPGDMVNLRIYPLNGRLSEVRFWCDGRLVDVQRIKNSDLNIAVF